MSDGVIVFAVYKAKSDKHEHLRQLIKTHVPLLRKLGFATERPSLVVKSPAEDTYIEMFEWVSSRTIDEAHANADVKGIWEKFDDFSDIKMLKDLREAGEMFPGFIPLDELMT